MTRKEAEEKILKALEEIHEAYFSYHPDGKWLYIHVSKDHVRAENSFSYGGEDYDHPVSCFKQMEGGKEG